MANIFLDIALVQMGVVWENPTASRLHAKQLLNAIHPECSVAVLPEMWSSGLSLSYIDAMPQEESELSLDVVSDWCETFGAWAVAGSLPWCSFEKKYNRCWVIDDAGNKTGYYDKLHLFSRVNESRVFTAGNAPFLFTVRGVSCAVVICYDLRFPELIRCLALSGVEVLFVVAQWANHKMGLWKNLLQGYAVANQIYLVGCNSCGEGDVLYGGQSVVVSPNGDVLANAGSTSCVMQTRIDLSVLRKLRARSPFIKDRRAELYAIISC